MRLTETQKNFRKQMKKNKKKLAQMNNDVSYKNHDRTVYFKEKRERRIPIGSIISLLSLAYAIYRFISNYIQS